MQLLIFRHGIAEERGPGKDDASRALTAEGVKKTKQAAAGLAVFANHPEQILTSPLLRAKQTAAIVGRVFDLSPRVLPELAHATPAELLAKLLTISAHRLLIVGHEPTLSQLIQLLCAHDETRHFIELKKAGCARVDFDLPKDKKSAVIPRGTLNWLATPAMLRAMAGGG